MPLPFSCPCGHPCSYLNKCFSDRTEGIAQFSKKIIKSTKTGSVQNQFNFPCINNEVSTIAQIYTYAIKKNDMRTPCAIMLYQNTEETVSQHQWKFYSIFIFWMLNIFSLLLPLLKQKILHENT